ELCLHVLWNLLSNPKKMKYRQISNSLLFRNVKNKCEEMKVETDSVLEIIRHYLKEFVHFTFQLPFNFSKSIQNKSLCSKDSVYVCIRKKNRENMKIAFEISVRIMSKIIFNENIDIPAIEKPGLYKRDTAKLYFILDNLYATQRSIKNNLEQLLHEVIVNDYFV
ncbi:hypothetical protein RFI_34487, partial [Reticulomyxa filosa]